ncbi:hypothetical protein [Mucilaginibacter sp.]|jgi:hypothetical protein|uniref:hypothetical protein n=1 Tax=Mucilaginibacter sp. TaxID=1882438 RepID=UPI003568FED5
MNARLPDMMVIFDYIFYRIAKRFYKKDGIDAERALVILAVIHSLLVATILIIPYKLFISYNEFKIPKNILRIECASIFIICYIFNRYRYKGMYWSFSERWKDRESYNQYVLNGYLVIVSIFIPFIILAATLHFLYAK